MENASKALIIAGGVLIAILLLTLFSYLFGQMAGSTSNIYSVIEESEIAEFNQQFLNYEGRGFDIIGYDDSGTPLYNPLTIQDVVTIINLAKDNNKSSKRPTTIKVMVNGVDWTNRNTSDLLRNNLNKQYKCAKGGVQIDISTLLVRQVDISNY